MNAPFTALDVIVFVVVALSGILAMLRGFTREVLSILSWVVALGAAVYAYLNVAIRDYVRTLVQPDWLADACLVGVTFLVVLIIISFITVRITDFILDSKVGAIDRTLGLLFGVARGAVLVAVLYLFFAWLVPDEQQPEWVRNAQARPLMEQSRDVILSFLPEDPADLIQQLPESLRDLGGGDSGGGRVPDTGGGSGPAPDTGGPSDPPNATPNSLSPDSIPRIGQPGDREASRSVPVAAGIFG